MTLCLKVKKEQAENLKKRLNSKQFLDNRKKILKKGNFVYLPLKNTQEKKIFGFQVLDHKFQSKKPKPRNLSEILKKKLSKEELKFLRTSYDSFEDIAIIEIPPELQKKEKIIGNALLKLHSRLRAVFKKAEKVKGTYRVRKLKLIAGQGGTETTYKESGCTFKLDPNKVYFSPRESTERLRIASQVKENENVLVMFAGIGSFPIILVKKQPKIKVCAVEINPDACKYMEENISLNKMDGKITVIQGDVKVVCPKLNEKFDRILMPLPKTSYKFLDVALTCLKDEGILHFYHWAPEKDLFTEAENLVRDAFKKFNKKVKILRKKKVLPYAPRTWKIVIDVKNNT